MSTTIDPERSRFGGTRRSILGGLLAASALATPAMANRLRLRRSGLETGVTYVSLYGAQFPLAGSRLVGPYLVGESPWALGPVTMVSEPTPATSLKSGTGVFQNNGPVLAYTDRRTNGMQFNPGNIDDTVLLGLPPEANKYGRDVGQGYDSLPDFAPEGGVSLPYKALLNRALGPLSNLNNVTIAKGVSSTAEPMTRPSLGVLSDLALLTVVSEIPPPDSFRPPQAWRDKTAYWQAGMVDASFLPNLPAPSGVEAPSYSALMAYLVKPWNWAITDNTGGGRTVNAANNQPNYGQAIAQLIGSAMLLLCTNLLTGPQKAAMQYALVQQGLDLYGRISAGNLGEFYQLGGGNSGPPFLLAFTARSLQGAPFADDMLSYLDAATNSQRWCEYGQHFTVPAKLTRIRPGPFGDRPLSQYRHYMVGMPDWTQTAYSPDGAGYNYDATYRSIVASSVFGCLLAARLMGLLPSMNFPVLSDYYDRYRNWIKVEAEGANAIPAFHRQFYDEQRGAIYGSAPVRTGVYAKEDQVWAAFSQQLDVSSAPSTSDVVITVNGSPATVSSIDVRSNVLAAILSAPLVGGETVAMAYTPGAKPLRNLSVIPASAFSAAATNRTSELPAPFTSAQMTYNGGVARSVLKWPLDQNKGVDASAGETAWIVIGVKAAWPVTPIAGGKVIGVASNGPCHLRTVSTTQIELLLSATSRCRFRPSTSNFNPAASTEPQTLWFSVDMSKLDKASGGMAAVINGAVQDVTTSEYTFDSTAGAFRFSLTQIWPSDLGIGAAQDGTSQSNVGLEYLFVAHGTNPADKPDITNSAVRAAMATGAIGGNGQNISGRAEFGFWPFTPEAANSAEGVINRGKQTDLPIVRQAGSWI